MNYWKLGCRWGAKRAGFPLFLDILQKHKIVISWEDKDYGINTPVLLTDGHTTIAYAITKSTAKTLTEYPEIKDDLEKNKISLEYGIRIYDAEILLIPEDLQFQYSLVQGICEIQQEEIIAKFIKILNINSKMENLSKKIELLKYKNQIILQGPPGTGKTKLAKEIALKMIGTNDDVNLNTYLKKGLSIPNASGADDYYLIEKVTDNSVELSSERATKKWSASFNKIREKLSQLQRGENPKNKGGDDPYVLAVAKHIFKNIKNSSDALKNNNQFKLIQFHPSYTYEDFVRGIVAKPNPDGDGIVYEAENKTLGIFAKTALENYNKSQVITTHNLIDNDFERFKNYVIEQIDLYGKFEISEKIYIYLVEDARFKYKGDTWTAHPNGLNMNFSQLIKIIEQNLNSRQEINKSELLNSLTRQHATYYQNFLELYRKYIDDNPIVLKEEKLKNYVLIIDEINRANLSSVLGELIYALEYRGEEVESMYEVDGSQKLILPPNLYIIGTMNTADRSVGHIDYAIRRRFAFVDVLPKNLIMELGSDFKKDIFTKVSELFIENYNPEIDYGPEESRLNRSQHLSEEFEPKDVWLGHSYFIQHYERDATGNNDIEQPIDFTLRLDYEIKPILREYVKDGILKPGALEIIENLGK